VVFNKFGLTLTLRTFMWGVDGLVTVGADFSRGSDGICELYYCV